jgi:hypothetical protein
MAICPFQHHEQAISAPTTEALPMPQHRMKFDLKPFSR